MYKSLYKTLRVSVKLITNLSGILRGVLGVFKPTPPPEFAKALHNRAKLNPIVKTVKN